MSQTLAETNGETNSGARTGHIATGTGNPTEPREPTAAISGARAPVAPLQTEPSTEGCRADDRTGTVGWSP